MKKGERASPWTHEHRASIPLEVMSSSIMAKPWREPQQLERRTRTLPPTNASAEFILKSVSLAERSQYVAELDKFVPLQEAQQHEETM